jgi:hypothetical protein
MLQAAAATKRQAQCYATIICSIIITLTAILANKDEYIKSKLHALFIYVPLHVCMQTRYNSCQHTQS